MKSDWILHFTPFSVMEQCSNFLISSSTDTEKNPHPVKICKINKAAEDEHFKDT